MVLSKILVFQGKNVSFTSAYDNFVSPFLSLDANGAHLLEVGMTQENLFHAVHF